MRTVTYSTHEPLTLRRQVLRAVMDATDADAGMYYRVTQSVPEPVVCDLFVEGSTQLEAVTSTFNGSRPPIGAACDDSTAATRARRGGWTIETTPPHVRARFRGIYDDFVSVEAFQRLPVYEGMYRPAGIVDQLRLMVFDGRRFLGWIGVMRRQGSGRFSASDRRGANQLVGSVCRGLSAARALSTLDHREEHHVVLTENGVVDCASAGAARWLTGERRHILSRVTRSDEPDGRSSICLDGVHVRWVRLDANPGVRYLVVLTNTAHAELREPSALTMAERRIAELAAAGLSVRDVAADTATSENTVKFHLRNVYTKLDVSTRVELARALAKSEP